MNKRIRNMIDEIFSDMKMTAENLALRDELLANAGARYEDAIAEGKTEEEAFAEVAASLEDVRSTLIEMNEEAPKTEPEDKPGTDDFGEAVGKAFDAIGDFGKRLFPEMSKVLQQADEATGKVFSGFGKAVGKGAEEVGRVAGETIEKLAKTIQESTKKELTADELLARAKEIRIQAEICQEADEQEAARDLRRKAYEMEMQAAALQEKEAKEKAEREAQEKTEAAQEDMDADLFEDAGEADDLEGEVEKILKDAEDVQKAEGIDIDDAEDVVVVDRFEAGNVHELDFALDADDVVVKASDHSDFVEVIWEAGKNKSSKPDVEVTNGTLRIRRKNPDVFKTFFSVFQKEGGKVTALVPENQLESVKISTTSGDVEITEVLTEKVNVNTTSGKIDVYAMPVGTVLANSVSGRITVEGNAELISVTTVSGDQIVKGNASRANLNTVSGSILVFGVFDEYDVDSVSGKVNMDCREKVEKVHVSTVSGTARVALPYDIHGFVAESNGIGGKLINDFGTNRFGTCEASVHFDSVNGKMIIVRGEA